MSCRSPSHKIKHERELGSINEGNAFEEITVTVQEKIETQDYRIHGDSHLEEIQDFKRIHGGSHLDYLSMLNQSKDKLDETLPSEKIFDALDTT